MFLITNYDDLYMPLDTKGRPLKHATYVKVPAKPNGRGLRALLEQPKGLRVFGIWVLLLELATAQKPQNRGKLLNHKDEPADAKQIAKDICLPKKVSLVQHALTLLISMGWVECTDKVRSEYGQGTDKVRTKSSVIESNREKSKYGTHILLFPSEYEKLVSKLGEQQTKRWIEELDLAIASKGYKYKSHCATILNWHRRKYPPSPLKSHADQEAIAKKEELKRQRQRAELSAWLQEKSVQELKVMRKQPFHRDYWFLIDEILKAKQ